MTDRNIIVDGNPRAEWYGARYWIADLHDGGHITIHANRFVINGGAVEFWGCHHDQAEDTSRTAPDYGKPKSDEYVLFAIPADSWKAVYAASVIDGSPVAVDHWSERG